MAKQNPLSWVVDGWARRGEALAGVRSRAEVAHEASVKVGACPIPMLFSSLLHGHLSPRSCHASRPSRPYSLPPLRKNQYLHSLDSQACLEVPRDRPLTDVSRKEWGGCGMRCGGEVWVSSSFSCPSPNRRRAGQGRGVHFHAPAPSLPPRGAASLSALALCLGTWFGSCRVGPPALGYEPVTPSCVWTFPPLGGPNPLLFFF